MLLAVASTCVATEARPAQQAHFRGLQVSPPGNTSLCVSEYKALLGLLGGNETTPLTSLYRTSVDGTTYDDLLDSVGVAEPLVFVIRKDKYVFGAFINCGLELPDNPTGWHEYSCDLWYFSLAGHFPQPTKIEFGEYNQHLSVAGREGSVYGANVEIGWWLRLGERSPDEPAADIRNCHQLTHRSPLPAGYTGARDSNGHAVLGGSRIFHGDEIEVLYVDGYYGGGRMQYVTPPNGTSLSASEYKALLGLLRGNETTPLTSLYRTSVNGTTYDDLLDSVCDVFVIRKDKYVFGAFINCGLELPDDPTSWHWYDCDLWYFSLAGHFARPTKIEIYGEMQRVLVAGREGSVWSANKYIVSIGGFLLLGDDEDSDQPAADIRSCRQYNWRWHVPAGYTGARDSNGWAVLGGSKYFHADEIEVLHVVDGQ
ncbi:unnamed protein product [Vitrella brassicaformis CCMP3155]|uniref:TLDc domain-containing protein n=2 Tax=Vitrella brassicaformis TaxID=1169539 RepID=A0A0G4EFS7_VITBC|nr:unnamed protein product [Vitrella brassicaformis CCMP3155]|eukprot:CEL94332.1 unnamed protein product [Vitrella brassicaformis CCMP3155]